MKAAVRSRFGPPGVIAIEDVAEPELTPDGVLVRVRAASPNRADVYAMLGRPLVARVEMGLRRPKTPRLGGDYAGTVEAVGSEVEDFRPGDEVFGGKLGAFAERLVVTDDIVHKPANLDFAQAATLPTAGVTALQALRDRGGLQDGERVLVNGASGGVGTFAIQIAKAMGATVTAVCSSANVDQARRLGADAVVDYTVDDVTRGDDRFDVVIDVAGSRPWSQLRRVLAPSARVVIVGGPSTGALLGPLRHIAGMRIASLAGRATATFFVARFNRPDFEVLARMAAAGQITPLVEATYPLSRTADAMRHMQGHVRSKLVITVP
ncbi:MAG TPA: NAD(P)-dependent alcohol dehydrogenase [Egicoccus sp.]|nr:NAD(P)-dependent alcohol dehydrogenase [Egicoccus sp.]HSK23821.1 NAD(P)-dependent alcohol dehydrogenase [Egicoccus sp.]